MIQRYLAALASLLLLSASGTAQEKAKGAEGKADASLREQIRRLRREVYNLQLSRVAQLIDTDRNAALPLMYDPRRCPPELRDFTWHLLHGACEEVRGKFPRRESWTFSRDGKTLVTLQTDRRAARVSFALFDTVTGRDGPARELVVKNFSSDPLEDCALSPDGKVLITTRRGGDFPQLWDVGTGRRIAVLPGRLVHLGIESYQLRLDPASDQRSFAADGKAVVTWLKNDVQFWDTATGKELRTLKGAGWPLTFTADGKGLLTVCPYGTKQQTYREDFWTGDKKLARVDLATGEVRDLFEVKMGGRPLVSADGGTLLTWSRNKGKAVEVWDVAAGKVRCAFTLPDVSAYLHLSPDGKTLAARFDNLRALIKLWDLTTGKEGAALPGHEHVGISPPATRLCFSFDGKILATGDGKGAIRLWDVATGSLRASYAGGQGTNGILSLQFSPDGGILTSLDDYQFICWNTPRGREPLLLQYDPAFGEREKQVDEFNAFVSWSPDGATLVSSGGGRVLHLWDGVTGKHRAALKGHSSFLTAWAMSPDGKLLASGDDKDVRLWNVADGKQRAVLTGQKAPVSALTFTPDGRRLAAGFEDGTIRLWDAGTAKPAADEDDRRFAPVRAAHKGRIRTLAFTGNADTLILHSGDGQVASWDLAKGTKRFSFKRDPGQDTWPRERLVQVVTVAPDGKTLALVQTPNRLTSLFSAQLSVLDTATGKPRGAVGLPSGGALLPRAYAPDGQSVAAGASSATLATLNLGTGASATPPPDPLAGAGKLVFRKADTLLATDPANPHSRDSRKKDHKVTLQYGKAYRIDVKAAPGSKLSPNLVIEPPVIGGAIVYEGADGGAAAHAHMIYRARATGTYNLLATNPAGSPLGAYELTVREIPEPLLWSGADVRCLAFSPDGKTLATGGGTFLGERQGQYLYRGEVRLWDPATGQERALLRRPGGRVMGAAFAPDGRTLAVIAQDGTVQLLRAGSAGPTR